MTLNIYDNPHREQLDAVAEADLSPANLRRVAECLHGRAAVFFAWDGEFQVGEARATPTMALASAQDTFGEDVYAEALEDEGLEVGMFAEDALMLIQLEELLDAGVRPDLAEQLVRQNRWRLGTRLDEEVSLGFIALWDVDADGKLLASTIAERLAQQRGRE